MNANQLGALVARSLAANESTGVCLRLVRQFIMDTERLDSAGVTENVREPAMLTGNRGWDALIAGVVEDLTFRHGVAVPRWALEPDRSTDDCWWFVTSIPALHPTAFVETPASLANRGVFMRRASLVNV